MKRRAHNVLLQSLESRVLFDSTVVFNEINYRPAGANSDNLEWVELHNQMGVAVDLSGWALSSGIDFTFPENTVIPGNGDLVIAKNPAALQAATGYANALGGYAGQLSNSGEKLNLKDKTGRVMDTITYDTKGDWAAAPDGSGVTLAKINPNTASDIASNWAASAQVNGTPGALNFASAPTTPAVRLNEISSGASGFVELKNTTNTAQDLTNYVIRRSSGVTSTQYVLPAQSLAANGLLSLSAATLGFTISSTDKIFLVAPGGNSVPDAVAASAATKARANDAVGRWLVPTAPTPGAANTFSLHDDVVINEVMYHHQPQQAVPGSVVSTTPVAFTSSGWKYNQSGTDLGTDWLAANYDDSAWSTGSGMFSNGAVGGSQTPVAIPGLWKTGFDANGNTTHGVDDGHYKVTTPGGITTNAKIQEPHPAWLSDDSNSQWIGADADGQAGQAGGTYIFKTTFNLAGYNPQTASITLGGLLVDNQVIDVKLNGVSVGFSYVGAEGSQTMFTVPSGNFTINSGFVSGVNTLEFDVTNEGAGPTGFRLTTLSGTVTPISIGTHLNVGSANTYYFRKAFNFSGDPSQTTLDLGTYIDDGAVFYLNGTEIYRQNMPAGAINYNTAAASAVGTPSVSGSGTLTLPAGLLVNGNNVLEVEVHQSTGAKTDIAMGVQTNFTQTIPPTPFQDSPEEWIELYNKSGSTVDISGWKLNNAVDYTFPAGTTIATGQYLVVAKDKAALAAKYPSITIVGDYSGSLANSDDLIQLKDAIGNPADEVHYYDSKPWPGAADGGGSSLELRDPTSDNSKPESWAASNEAGKSTWNSYSYTGVANTAGTDPTQWKEFILGLLDTGEVLLDNIVVADVTAGTSQVLQNGTFENGTTSSWRIIGNHHGTVITDPTNPSNHVLDLVATGATETMHNHTETTLAGGLSIIDGHTYTISYNAKWISGSNLLNTHLFFNRVAKTTIINVPQNNGTPGAQNSRYIANAGPVFSGLSQNVVYPSAGQAVTISVNAADEDGMGAVSLLYSVNGGSWQTVPMSLQSSGQYAATIPGQASSAIVQFYVSALDSLGAVATYPAAGAKSRALYKVNDGVSQGAGVHTIRIVMTAADSTTLQTLTNVMSNEDMGATVIYDNNEIFYDVGVALHSSERGRDQASRVGFNLDFNADHLFKGSQSSLVIDRSSSTGGTNAEILLKQAMNHAANGLLSNYNDVIKVIAPNSANTGTALLQQDPYGNAYLDAMYDNGSDNSVYKLELIYYPTTTVDGNPESLKVPEPDDVRDQDIADLGNNKEAYRYHFLLSNNREKDDFSAMMTLGKAFSQPGTANGSPLDLATQQAMDVDEWMRLFALQSLGGVGDSYGFGYSHNVKMYQRPTDSKVIGLQWDWDFAFANGTSSSLFPGSNIGNIVAIPTNKHLFYGHLQDIINNTLNAPSPTPGVSYMAYWASIYATASGTGANGLSGGVSYLAQRASFAQSQLPPQVAFSITSPNNQTVNTPTVTLTGKGWVNVKNIFVQGSISPLKLTWSGGNVDTWTASVPVYSGSNHLVLQAYDFQGNLIGTQSIDVTSTANLPNLPANLRVTELNYNPAAPTPAENPGNLFSAQDFEFIELKNYGSVALNLQGAHFINGIDFTFDNVTLAPGQVGVVVANVDAFRARYGNTPLILGNYAASNTNFDNGGERVTLVDSTGQTVFDFTYDDDPAAGWYATTDGGGATLEVVNPSANLDLSNPANWLASPAANGTPGVDDSVAPAAPAGPVATGGADKVTLNWAAVPGAGSYNVYRSTTSGAQGASPLITGLTTNSFVDLTAVGGVTYFYQISATTPGGEGARSIETSAYSHMPGDANDDLTVDFNDLVVVAQNYNTTGGKTWSTGDFTGDGNVDFNDLVLLAQNYNTSRLPAPSAPTPAPTPSAAIDSPTTVSSPQVTAPAAPSPAPVLPVPTPIVSKPVPPYKTTPPKPVTKPAPVKPTAPPKPVAKLSAPTIKPVAKPTPTPPTPTFSSTRIQPINDLAPAKKKNPLLN